MKEQVVFDAALGIAYILARDLLPCAQSFGTKEFSGQVSAHCNWALSVF